MRQRRTLSAARWRDADPPSGVSKRREGEGARSGAHNAFSGTLALAVLVLAAAPPARAADLLDLHTVALANDPRFRAALHERDAVRENRSIARAGLLPEITGTATFGRERNEITTGRQNGGDTTRTETSEPWHVGWTLRQPLFDAAAWARLARAGAEIAEAEATFLAARQDLAMRISTAYFDALAAGDDLRLVHAEREAVARELRQAESRFRAGIAAIVDVREAEARHDLTLAAILEAERRLLASRDTLAEITGESAPEVAPVGAKIPLGPPDPDDPAVWIGIATEESPELAIARARAAAATQVLREARAGHLPGLDLQAGQVVGESSGFDTGDFDTQRLFLGLSIPIFEGLETIARTRQAARVLAARRAEVDAAERATERRVRDAFRGVITDAARVRALARAVTSVRMALEASRAGVNAGTRTLVDVLTAQQLLYEAERDASRARYDLLLSRLALERAAGRLDEHVLATINALLTGPTKP